MDTSVFAGGYELQEVDLAYEIGIQGDRLTCAFEGADEIMHSYRNGRLEVYLDSAKRIVGLAVCDLDEGEIRMVHGR